MDDIGNITNKDLYRLIQGVVQSNEEIKEQNKVIREEIKREFQTVKSNLYKQLKTVEEENDKLKEENERLKARVTTLEVRNSVVERRQKKYNLIVYGLTEEDEGRVDSQRIVDIFNKKLEVSCTIHDLRDVYRIGKKDGTKIRPIGIEVIQYKLKLELLRNSKKLKGTKLYITQDYILEDYEKRKILHKHLKEARANNIPAKINNNTLILNGDKFTVEELLAQEAEVSEGCETSSDKEQELEILAESVPFPSKEEKTSIQKQTAGTSRGKGKQIQSASNENLIKRSNRLRNVHT